MYKFLCVYKSHQASTAVYVVTNEVFCRLPKSKEALRVLACAIWIGIMRFEEL